jgi:molybdopterin/thiamine biosynthesis adenylyltransferase/rhodanese-related sulfurtransferase
MERNLSPDEKIRYSRQTILSQIGVEGQLQLKNARILMIGAGGLGSSPAIYLAAAGVGTIGLVDDDKVSLSNLHRQILHYTSDLDKPKVLSAREKLEKINPHVHIITHQTRLTAANARELFADYDLILDGTDNLPSRYLINDACVLTKKNFIFGGVFQFEGQLSIFGADGPCYRCLFRDPPPPDEMPSCAEAGVIGVIPGIIGLMQANEAIKWICQIGEPLVGRLLIYDALTARLREIKIKKDPDCPVCGTHPTITALQEYNWQCADDAKPGDISVQELKQQRTKNPKIYLLDVREQNEWDIARIEGAHLKPLSTLKDHFNDVPKDQPVYCFCKMGGRSAKAVAFLKSQGYANAVNVKGGIQAWSVEIDSSVPQY